MKRKNLSEGSLEETQGYSFTEESILASLCNKDFFSSGATILDLITSKGLPLGRMVNLVGDKSTGKTLLAIEACANFAQSFPEGKIRYVEAEAAFDVTYASTLGLPIKRLELIEDISTVEELFADLDKFLDSLSVNTPALYVLDSLDALSDAAEQEREFDKASFGQDKAKKLGKLFRMLIKKLRTKKCCLLIISQIRDNIGVTFGETKQRSGGHSLDFYASVILWLSEIKKFGKTIAEQDYPIGVHIRIKNKKNKLGPPYRVGDVRILFGYGIDDEFSCLDYLAKMKYDAAYLKVTIASLKKARKNADDQAMKAIHTDLKIRTKSVWASVEAQLAPGLSKYGSNTTRTDNDIYDESDTVVGNEETVNE